MEIEKQRVKVRALLSSPSQNGLTRMQVARCLGIERSSVCGRVNELMKENSCWVIRTGICPITHHRAEFLTTNEKVMEALLPKVETTGRLF